MTNYKIHDTSKYAKAIGEPKTTLGVQDYIRQKIVAWNVTGHSLLDVGAFNGEFLLSQKKRFRKIAGTDINKARVGRLNKNLRSKKGVVDFVDGKLHKFDDNTFDTVTCLEVIEHINNPRAGIQELIRVAKKRVIITVPYKQNLSSALCIHCNKYTPWAGHLHSFDSDSIKKLVPKKCHRVRIIRLGTFGKALTNFLAKFLPVSALAVLTQLIGRISDRLSAHIMIIIDI